MKHDGLCSLRVSSPKRAPTHEKQPRAIMWKEHFVSDFVWHPSSFGEAVVSAKAYTVSLGMESTSQDMGTYWLIEQGLTSPPTRYKLYGREFYKSKQYQSTGLIREMLVLLVHLCCTAPVWKRAKEIVNVLKLDWGAHHCETTSSGCCNNFECFIHQGHNCHSTVI